jgi:hypothetical protein
MALALSLAAARRLRPSSHRALHVEMTVWAWGSGIALPIEIQGD